MFSVLLLSLLLLPLFLLSLFCYLCFSCCAVAITVVVAVAFGILVMLYGKVCYSGFVVWCRVDVRDGKCLFLQVWFGICDGQT